MKMRRTDRQTERMDFITKSEMQCLSRFYVGVYYMFVCHTLTCMCIIRLVCGYITSSAQNVTRFVKCHAIRKTKMGENKTEFEIRTNFDSELFLLLNGMNGRLRSDGDCYNPTR